MKIIYVVLAAWLVTGCAGSGGSRPAWVDNPQGQYSESLYLTGTGSASNINDAKERARADLVKVFEVRIKSIVEDIQTAESVKTAQGRSEVVTNRSSINISSETDHLIQGVKIAEVWEDRASRNFYAIAVLERSQAINNMHEEVRRLDDVTADYLQNSDKSSNKLYQVGQYTKAIEAQQGRDVFHRYMKILDQTGRGVPSKWQTEKLSEQLDGLLTSIGIAVKSEDKNLQKLVTGGISLAGFKAVDQAKADYLIQAAFELDQFKDKEEWHWARGALKITLDDLQTGKSQGTKRWPLKASASSADMAKTRLYDKVEKLLADDLRAAILRMAE